VRDIEKEHDKFEGLNEMLTSDGDSSVVILSTFVSADNFGWAWISMGGGTSMTSFSRSSPVIFADGEHIVVKFDGADNGSVILKIPFTPAWWSTVFVVEF